MYNKIESNQYSFFITPKLTEGVHSIYFAIGRKRLMGNMLYVKSMKHDIQDGNTTVSEMNLYFHFNNSFCAKATWNFYFLFDKLSSNSINVY